MSTLSLPGSYPEDMHDPPPPYRASVSEHPRSLSDTSPLSWVFKLHLEVAFESRMKTGYAGRVAGFVLGIFGFIVVCIP